MNAPGSAGAAKTVSLDQVSPPRLFFALLHQRFKGALTLNQPDPNPGLRTVWFDGGMPVFTDWLEQTDVLGQVLMELGLIGQAQLYAALEAMQTGGGLLGEHLLKQGVLDPAALGEGLRKQCFRKLVHLFSLRGGEVSIIPSNEDVGKLGKVNVLELIGIGIGAHYDLSRIQTELGPTLMGPVQATAALTRYRTHFRFRPSDESVLASLAQGTTFDQLVGSGVPALRAGQLIYMLWACQMLRTGVQTQRSATQQAAANPRVTKPAAPRPAAGSAPPAAAPKAPPKAAAANPDPPRPAAPKPAAKPAAAPKPAAKEAEMSAEDAEFVADLERFEKKIAAKTNPFDLLGLELTAGRKEIRRAWGDLSKKLHPDSLQARGLARLRDRVNDVFAALSEAQGLLNDKEKRQELKEAIERGDNPMTDSADAAAQARAVFESELLAKDADKLLKSGRFQRAHEKYAEALELNPNEDDLRAAASWCVYNLSEKTRTNATAVERVLAEIVQTNPRIARAHYFRGHVLKDMGAIEAAIISFEEALANDTRLIDAERQARALRVAQGRSASTSAPKKRGIKGLFGKR